MLLKSIFFLICFIVPHHLFSQSDTLVINLKGGAQEKIAVEDLEKITFDGISSAENSSMHVKEFRLTGNYPNPFSSSTQIEFEIQKPGNVEIRIYNMPGVCVKTLLCENCPIGRNSLEWDGRDESGRQLPGGVYYYEIRFGGEISSKQMIMIK